MGKIGVVLAILAFGTVAVILLSALWARLGALGNAPMVVSQGIGRDQLRDKRESRAPRATTVGPMAVVTMLRPREEHVSAS